MARSFQGLWEAGRVYLPEGQEWAQDLLRQLTRFPMGTLDDKVDCCSLFSRLIAQVWEQDPPKPAKPEVDLPAGTHPFKGMKVDDLFQSKQAFR